ncbi:MAG: 2-succinyl-5-enolpyruvyl-6-hydroxy-3-cyclohexene-1-carboxylic-acid synthase [Verrucomicrobiales bacterium]|nr:2-succinyl-5-enolpyruvyl-6-hydroxy-3-cyclohexene-1-carboxylic-acid synthase [Verrucomicrobiales bacterium]
MSEDNEAIWSNERLAFEVIQTCWWAGSREFVICAGSRNSPLVLQLLRLQHEHGDLKIWHFFEERSAAFFALGRAKITGEPATVVTTSGTAAAELLPAVIEAHYAALPLILVTADRPVAFRYSGAPQAIDQQHLFGRNVERFLDVSVQHHSELDGMDELLSQRFVQRRWHINVAFDEPLVSPLQVEFGRTLQAMEVSSASSGLPAKVEDDEQEMVEGFGLNSATGVVLVGNSSPAQDQQAWVQALVDLAWPIWAEASSGLREEESLNRLIIKDEADFFTDFINQRKARVLRLAGVPSLRFWRDLEEASHVEVLSLAATGGFSGLARESKVLRGDALAALRHLVDLGGEEKEGVGQSEQRVEALLLKYPLSEPAWIRRWSQLIPEGSLVFLGNSMPIREWNLAATFESRRLFCHASRGANGIDGQLSTFLGMSADQQESWGLFGDLTTLYDLSAPSVWDQLPAGKKRRLLVINNGGGRIFSRLPHLASLPEDEQRVVQNRHQVGFEHWAAMWGMDYLQVSARQDLLEYDWDGAESLVIELCPDLQQTEAFWQDEAKAL